MAFSEAGQAFGCLHRRIPLGRDPLLEKFPEKAGNAGVTAGSLDPRPLGDIFFERYGHIAQAATRHDNSVTRFTCSAKP